METENKGFLTPLISSKEEEPTLFTSSFGSGDGDAAGNKTCAAPSESGQGKVTALSLAMIIFYNASGELNLCIYLLHQLTGIKNNMKDILQFQRRAIRNRTIC